jgi:predicted enzyme related to lactoylglutathione lyase
MANLFNWVEIPVNDLGRAETFYRNILGHNEDLPRAEMGGMDYAFLPMDEQGVGGALVKSESYIPNAQGVTVYLNVKGDLNATLAKIEPAGGKVIVPKTSLGDMNPGYFAHILDAEGNRIGLYSEE